MAILFIVLIVASILLYIGQSQSRNYLIYLIFKLNTKSQSNGVVFLCSCFSLL